MFTDNIARVAIVKRDEGREREAGVRMEIIVSTRLCALKVAACK